MFSSKKPKFSLNLTINELSNIPQISGYCYIELSIKDSKRSFNGLTSFKTHAPADVKDPDNNATSSSDNNSVGNSKLARSLTKNNNGNLFSSTSELDNSSSSTTSSGNVTVTTSKKRIHNFKCSFDYQLSCNLKFPFKKRENLIANKYLTLRVFYINESQPSSSDASNHDNANKSHHYTHGHTVELGRLEINLSEYLNFTEPVTSKYLLRDSKVNSILNLTVELKELPSNYDFHTQLQISDTPTNHNHPSTAPALQHHSTHNDADGNNKRASKRKPPSINTSTTSRFNVPQFERKKVFGGLNDVIQSPTSESSMASSASSINGNNHHGHHHQPHHHQHHLNSPTSSNFSSDESSDSNVKKSSSSTHHRFNVGELLDKPPPKPSTSSQSGSLSRKSSFSKLRRHASTISSLSSVSTNSNSQSNAVHSMSGNLASTLNQQQNPHQNITMDPIITKLYRKILESTWDPELHNLLSYSPERCVEDIFDSEVQQEELRRRYSEWSKPGLGLDEGDDDNVRDINGLINEIKYREDLRSWTVGAKV